MLFELQVWLEPVPAAHVTRLAFIPHLDQSKVSLEIFGSEGASGLPVQVPFSHTPSQPPPESLHTIFDSHQNCD